MEAPAVDRDRAGPTRRSATSSLAGLLSWILKDCPSVDMCDACPLPARCQPRPNEVLTGVSQLPFRVACRPGPSASVVHEARLPLPFQPDLPWFETTTATFPDRPSFAARLRPEVATPRVPFRPCRFSRLRRLAPRMQCRSVAPCCRPWGSPGCRPPTRPLAAGRASTSRCGADPASAAAPSKLEPAIPGGMTRRACRHLRLRRSRKQAPVKLPLPGRMTLLRGAPRERAGRRRRGVATTPPTVSPPWGPGRRRSTRR